MLPIALVLLVVNNVLAEPITAAAEPASDKGYRNTSASIDKAWYILAPKSVNHDAGFLKVKISVLARRSDRSSQALALAQIIAMVGYYSRSIQEDFCTQLDVINSVTNGDYSSGDVDSAVLEYLETFNSTIDTIVQKVTDPKSLGFVRGPKRDVCNDPPEWSAEDKNSYKNYIKKWEVVVEAAWKLISNNAAPNTTNLFVKQYNTLNRLLTHKDAYYNNFNVAIAVTAASLPDCTSVFEKAFESLARFVNSFSKKADIEAAGEAAKDAVSQAIKNKYSDEE